MTELNIGDAVLGNKGATLIFQALGQGKSGKLEKLCVQYGEFNGKALATLVAAVEKLPLLRRIELNGNKFSKNHTHLEPLRELLAGRKKDQDDDDDDAWGLDELDELDYDSDEPEESDEEEEEEIVADDSDQEKETPISDVEKDKDVLELTKVLEKTDI
jgi:Ran GTPase-activating protein 1